MNALIIFVKNPVPGKTKTRLAKDLGNDQALKIYNSLLDYTRAVCSMVHAERYLFYSNEIVDDAWPSSSFVKQLQEGSDLGQRMGHAFQDVLNKHDKAIIIGSDCPQLDFITISQAFQALDQHDYVIGPSLDGGYYLLGMKSAVTTVFQNISWSTEAVKDQTIEKIKDEDKSFKLLQTLSDVDHKADWDKYGWEL